ncbi:unnamed protein product, partial [marine sediment metagenome]
MGSGFRWIIQNWKQAWANSIAVISFDTDIAVHAWLRYTDKAPRMHLLSKTVRGLRKMSDPYYCFVAWKDLEQIEAGDTLHHTFNWPGWYTCLWQWFYFWSTLAGQITPSQWGIFKKHYQAREWSFLFTEPWTRIIVPRPMCAKLFED